MQIAGEKADFQRLYIFQPIRISSGANVSRR